MLKNSQLEHWTNVGKMISGALTEIMNDAQQQRHHHPRPPLQQGVGGQGLRGVTCVTSL